MMNAIELMKELGEIGVRYHERDINPAILYFTKMIEDGRVIVIRKDSEPHLVLTFSVTDDCEPFLLKDCWDFLPHNPSGKQVYFEKLFSKGWDKELRKAMEAIILKLYPNVQEAVWHRMASWGDRKVIARRRLAHV